MSTVWLIGPRPDVNWYRTVFWLRRHVWLVRPEVGILMVSVVELDIGIFVLLFVSFLSWAGALANQRSHFLCAGYFSSRTTTFCSCALERSNFTLIGMMRPFFFYFFTAARSFALRDRGL